MHKSTSLFRRKPIDVSSIGLLAAVFDILYYYAALIDAPLRYFLLNRWSNWLRLVSVIILVAVGWRLLRQARRMRSMQLTSPAKIPRAQSQPGLGHKVAAELACGQVNPWGELPS